MRYAVLVADPPWPFGDALPGARGASSNYDLLSVDQIQQFELPELADDATLFLWRVASMQEEALSVIRAWDFTLKTELIWLKKNEDRQALVWDGPHDTSGTRDVSHCYAREAGDTGQEHPVYV